MSNRYKGGVISATPPTTTGGDTGTASGSWTLEQQMQLQAAGLWPIQPTPPFIEDVFSCFLYTGTGAAQTITNGIDLSTKGGLVWIKGRNNSWNNILQDTNRGINSSLTTNNTDGAINPAGAYLSSFNSSGFSLGTNGSVNFSTNTYASWTFREKTKFFDVVTYTGTGAVQTIAHNLGSAPGCIIVKKFSGDGDDWGVYHRSLGATYKLNLNTSDAAALSTGYWNNTEPTSTEFTVATSGITNQSGATYIAYLFAHDAGGFGLSGTDNVISCGSFNSTAFVDLGYEPQWLMYKRSSGAEDWNIADTMRGFNTTNDGRLLFPNLSSAESASGSVPSIQATGFTPSFNGAGATYIYIAIRRGPMKVPTTGTSVFNALSRGSASIPQNLNVGFPTDLAIGKETVSNGGWVWGSRLTGANFLQSNNTNAEAVGPVFLFDKQNTLSSVWNSGAETDYAIGRAPGFFDEVCYTGTGVAGRTVTHNLTVAPELMIVKPRSAATAPNWRVWSPINSTDFNLLQLSTDGAASSSLYSNSNVFPAIPTASTFTVGGSGSIQLNESGQTFVAYLFATCAGVSKVGSYTGNAGYTVTVPCGFTAGVRFVFIKRTDSTGDWWVYDSARGITAGNDPYLYFNSTAAEVGGTDYIDSYSAGFEVTSTAPAGLNATGGTYIFLAIA